MKDRKVESEYNSIGTDASKSTPKFVGLKKFPEKSSNFWYGSVTNRSAGNEPTLV